MSKPARPQLAALIAENLEFAGHLMARARNGAWSLWTVAVPLAILLLPVAVFDALTQRKHKASTEAGRDGDGKSAPPNKRTSILFGNGSPAFSLAPRHRRARKQRHGNETILSLPMERPRVNV